MFEFDAALSLVLGRLLSMMRERSGEELGWEA
jgi:hypothetical protein